MLELLPCRRVCLKLKQKCFNAIHHAPNAEIRKRIGADLRNVWNTSTLAKHEAALAELVPSPSDAAIARSLSPWGYFNRKTSRIRRIDSRSVGIQVPSFNTKAP